MSTTAAAVGLPDQVHEPPVALIAARINEPFLHSFLHGAVTLPQVAAVCEPALPAGKMEESLLRGVRGLWNGLAYKSQNGK